MAFNIKDEELVEEVRRLANRTGESMSEAIARSVRERAARIERDDDARRARVMRVVRRCQARAAGKTAPDIDSMLYDAKTGLPR